ncbi:hypothetical protein [Streptomyces sp. S1D4-20]|uniref:hypothetical protein n=1 Tax=Streptomyces sp. S1D4-20 TaxID=2594462 RepID=UPI0011625CA2|nr:hypothetical protein [Streptomyces sp. S1D4-20]QDN54216.1 hypothetical protein FNV67_01205 [Streptomyces sp. S1D4-20]
MTTMDLKSGTARQARDLLNAVTAELEAAKLSRSPGDDDAQYQSRRLPLRMTLHFARGDEARYQEMIATTLGGARDIVRAASNLIRAESLQLHPGDEIAQYESLDRPLVVSVHYDLDDLDRTDLLGPDVPQRDSDVPTDTALTAGPASDGPAGDEREHTARQSLRARLSTFLAVDGRS